MNVRIPSRRGDLLRRPQWQPGSLLAGIFLTVTAATMAQPAGTAEKPAVQWTNVPWADSNFFPIAAWLQDPPLAERYRQAGINTYVGLWEGPTEDQLTTLKKAGMWVVCGLNETGRRHRDDTNIIAWMHGDEPDNGQSRGARFGFGSPIPPETATVPPNSAALQAATAPFSNSAGRVSSPYFTASPECRTGKTLCPV